MSEYDETQDDAQGDNIETGGQVDPRILARIRGLFASAESLAGTPAAESYEDKAMELLSKHGIAKRVAMMRDDTVKVMTRKVIQITGAYLPQRRTLLSDIGRVYGVYVTWNYDPAEKKAYNEAINEYNEAVRDYHWMGGPKPGKAPTRPKRNSMSLHGYDTDIERTELLYTLLVAQSYAALKKVTQDDIPWHFDGNIRSWRTSFFDGWIRKVYLRVRDMETKEVEEVSSSTALVLVNPHAQAKLFAESDGTKAKAEKRAVRSATAYSQGFVEGDNANIGQTGVAKESAVRALG